MLTRSLTLRTKSQPQCNFGERVFSFRLFSKEVFISLYVNVTSRLKSTLYVCINIQYTSVCLRDTKNIISGYSPILKIELAMCRERHIFSANLMNQFLETFYLIPAGWTILRHRLVFHTESSRVRSTFSPQRKPGREITTGQPHLWPPTNFVNRSLDLHITVVYKQALRHARPKVFICPLVSYEH